MARTAKVVKIACAASFLIGGLGLVSAMTQAIIAVPFALVPLFAAIGILRGRAWSAYGYALCLFSTLCLIPFVAPGSGAMIATAILVAALIGLFVAAGRSLQSSGAERGSPTPWIIVAVMCTLPFIFVRAYIIPTGSMENTLLRGDRILTRKYPKPMPRFGDLVVFVMPPDRRYTTVQRIIGLPGDHIRISNKIVYRNGATLPESYAVHMMSYPDAYRDNFPGEPSVQLYEPGREMLAKHVMNGEVIVPEGHYFVLGDNRDNSLDSRYWGFIATSDIVGKPVLIYDSKDESHRERWDRLLRVL